MPDDIDHNDEDLGKAMAAMLASSRAYPLMIEAMRALGGQFSANRTEKDVFTDDPDQNAPKEPLSLLVEANAMLLARSAQYWKQWQDIVSEHVPTIADELEAYSEAKRAGADQGNVARNKVIDAFRRYALDMATLPKQHGAAVAEDLDKLAREYLGQNPATPARRRKRP